MKKKYVGVGKGGRRVKRKTKILLEYKRGLQKLLLELAEM